MITDNIRFCLIPEFLANDFTRAHCPKIAFITNFVHPTTFNTINPTQSYPKTENVSCNHIPRGPIPSQGLHFTNMFCFQQQLPGSQESRPALEGMPRRLARGPRSCMAKDYDYGCDDQCNDAMLPNLLQR